MVRNLANFHWNPPFGGVRLHSTYGLKMPLLLRVAAPSNHVVEQLGQSRSRDQCERTDQIIAVQLQKRIIHGFRST